MVRLLHKTFLLLFLSVSAYSQRNADEWKPAEAFLSMQLKPIENVEDLRLLGERIRNHFPDTMNRLRTAYLWVTRNISYDCDGLINKNSRWALNIVLKARKAVCAGYVNVFRNLCLAAGIECVDITGYGRSGFESLLVKSSHFASNHTWNAVKVGSEWKLVDVTWASGFTTEDCSRFTFHRNDWYFCADPTQFAWDHFPQDSSWQLLDQPISWNEFYRYPLLYQGMMENNIEDFYPRSVIINKKVGDTIVFHFKSRNRVNRIIISSRQHKQVYLMDTPDKTPDGYRYVYRIPKEGAYDLQVDLLQVENRNVLGAYEIKTFTDIVYWINTYNISAPPTTEKSLF
jgi:hypothetical protein